jgi:NDP-sugar pyrophosphorylase family protein
MILEECKVIITCSGLGSRLGEYTEYTNKSLVRVGSKAVISHIIDNYPVGTNFVITLGHYGDHVKQYIEIAHPKLNVEFIDVENYHGDGSSLGRSLLSAKKAIGTSFIFNACDTITDGIIPENSDHNKVWVVASKNNSAVYRTVQCSGTNVCALLEKGESVSDAPVYIGKCYIKDAKSFWDNLEEILAKSNNSEISDCHVINKMIKSSNRVFSIQYAPFWYDIGNLNDLKTTRTTLGDNTNVLDKYNESIFFIEEFVIKFFNDETVLKNRVERSKILDSCTPTVIDHSKNFMKYKLVNGDILCNNKNLNGDLIYEMLNYSNSCMWSNSKSNTNSLEIENLCRKFYIEKTKKRVEMFTSTRNIKDDIDIINGVSVESVNKLLDRACSLGLLSGVMGNFHGDFILENIIFDNKGFTFIDWRQDFAGEIELGDVYYDLAKLNHNIYFNHSIIRDGGYLCEIESNNKSNNNNSVSVDLMCSHKLLSAKKGLVSFCKDNNFSMKKIEMLTGIIWINMSPLHDKLLGDFLFYFGKLQLHKSIIGYYN